MLELELLFKKDFLKIVSGEEPLGTLLDIIPTEEKGVLFSSIALTWEKQDLTLNKTSSAYLNLCKKALSLLDEKNCILWEKIWEVKEEIIGKKIRLDQEHKIDFTCTGIEGTNKRRKFHVGDDLVGLLEELILEEQRREGDQLIGSRALDSWGDEHFDYLFSFGASALDQAEFFVSCGKRDQTIAFLNDLDEQGWEELDLWTFLEVLDPIA
jgi:hypothetical protein